MEFYFLYYKNYTMNPVQKRKRGDGDGNSRPLKKMKLVVPTLVADALRKEVYDLKSQNMCYLDKIKMLEQREEIMKEEMRKLFKDHENLKQGYHTLQSILNEKELDNEFLNELNKSTNDDHENLKEGYHTLQSILEKKELDNEFLDVLNKSMDDDIEKLKKEIEDLKKEKQKVKKKVKKVVKKKVKKRRGSCCIIC